MSTPNNERLDALMRDLRAEAARGLTPLDRAHTPEPWDETTHSRTWRETGGVITQIYRAMIDEDYDRTRACVNACAGMPDPAAEIARLREVNAALLEALKRITGRCERYLSEQLPSESEMYDSEYVSVLEQANAAITKAEEKP